MRIAAITPVYNEAPLVRGCIESLRNVVDEHIMLVSEKPYYGDATPPDDTGKIAEQLGATVIYGQWPLDHHQRNTGIAMLQKCDWIICTDVDMWFTKKDAQAIVDILRHSNADAFVIRQKAYWHDTDHVLEGDDFMPVIAIRPHVRFTHIGNIDSKWQIMEGPVCHHINWCHPKDIYKKVTTYSHAPEFDGKVWYEKNFKNWDKNSGIAVLPNKTFSVLYSPLPEELQCYLK